jgi:hypothetical protein
MRWNFIKPRNGDTRVRKQFCWFPTVCEYQWIWLENIWIKQQYVCPKKVKIDNLCIDRIEGTWQIIDSWLKARGPNKDRS